MKTPTTLTLLLLVAATLGLGCGTSATATPPAPGETPTPHIPGDSRANAHDPTGPAVEAPSGPAGAEITDVGFTLRATAAGPYHAGQPGSFGLTLTPGGGYHVNEEYPIRVAVSAPEGLAFPKPTLTRADAAEFGPARARFDVPFTAAGVGERRVELTVGFAVCTPERCMPDERTLALALPVIE